jgi:hypothetical protein
MQLSDCFAIAFIDIVPPSCQMDKRTNERASDGLVVNYTKLFSSDGLVSLENLNF